MTEALIRHEAGDKFVVCSAGTHPAPVRLEAVAAMRELGIDISRSVRRVDRHYSQPTRRCQVREAHEWHTLKSQFAEFRDRNG
jgi:protein-tyrosine-phosphatase